MTINKVAQALINFIVAKGWELIRLEVSVAQIPMVTIVAFRNGCSELTIEVNEHTFGRVVLTMLLGYISETELTREFLGYIKGSTKNITKILDEVESFVVL